MLLKADSDIKNVKATDGKFCVPKAMEGLVSIDVGFVLRGKLFDFGERPMWQLSVPWDVSFGGREFGRRLGQLKSINAKTACSVEFQAGEPGMGIIISPCRSKLGKRKFPAPE